MQELDDQTFPLEHRRISTHHGSLSYYRGGNGAPLVLLHSLALSGRMWGGYITSELTKFFDVIAVDLRGHGMSDYGEKPFSVEDMSGDLEHLFEQLNLNEANVLGLSMGGCVAISFAAKHPSRVVRLVLCDTTAWYGENALTAWAERAHLAVNRPRVEQIPFQVDRWFSESFRRLHPDDVARVCQIFLSANSQVHAYACEALGRFDGRNLLSSIVAPTLVITGENDSATPPEMGKYLAERIDGASFQLGRNLQHFAILENPAIRRRVVNFLSGSRGESDDVAADDEQCCELHTSPRSKHQ